MSLLSPPLQAFMAIVKHKTVHAAADAIFLTQTAVTQRIRVLERQLKTTLFIRTRRGMQLTSEGLALLRYCQATRDLEGEALAKIQGTAMTTEIQVSISAATSIMHSRVIPSCLPIMKAYPGLLLTFDVNDTENRHLSLRTGSCDFAIIHQKYLTAELQYKELKSEQYVLVASSRWKGRRLRDIVQNERVIDYDETDQITCDYLKQYDLMTAMRPGRYYVNRTDNLALLVSEGIGYTTLAREFAMPYVKTKQLIILNQGKTYDVDPVLVWYARHQAPRYFTEIINAIK